MSFDPTKPVQARGGWEARIVSTDLKNHKAPEGGGILAVLTNPITGFNEVITCTPEGRVRAYMVDPFDLINVPERHVRWVNFYEVGTAVHRSTRQEADEYEALRSRTRLHRIACIRVEFEEGEGLS